jgi:two-component system nitrate/nitrite response regulator NarL
LRRESPVSHGAVLAKVGQVPLGHFPYTLASFFAMLGGRPVEGMAGLGGEGVADHQVILIVTSDGASRSLLAGLFKGAGYATAEVERGGEALTYAKRARPAVVLLDVKLGDISGYEVCYQLRQRFGEELSIIFMSGERTEPEDRVAGLLIGADDYITKPFDSNELLARVRRGLIKSALHGGAVDSQLTPREHEVLGLLATGIGPDDVAHKLFISPKTVGTHIQRILTKLGVHSRMEAVAIAYRTGLVDRDVG